MTDKDESKNPKSDEAEYSTDLFQKLLERFKSGKNVDPEEYITRYPNLTNEVNRLIKLLSTSHEDDVVVSTSTDNDIDIDVSRTIGDFKINREIGKGGMGTVYEAEQISLNRKVALKLLPSHLSLSDEAVQKFKREAKAGGRQSHPGIVAVYAVGEEKGVHFIVQELVEGGRTLANALVEYHRQPELHTGYYKEVAQLFIDIADALQHAHESGVTHRDVKPSNILITPDGTPKVTDFGLAKIEDALALSRTGDFAGTPYYMSPEQAMSRRIGVDHRTDIFSLGATLYEAITFNRAFDGDTSQQVLEKITLVDPLDPRRVRSRIPRDLAAICLKALEKRRERRYQSMEEFAADLQRFLKDEVIIAKPPGLCRRAIKWTRRYPVISASGAVAAVAFVAIVFFWWRAEDQRTRAVAAEEAAKKAEQEIRKQFDEINRLSDIIKHLSNLEEKADELWPAHLENIDGLKSWLDLAEELTGRLADHRTTLEILRQSALPYTEKAKLQDRKEHPKRKELVDARASKEQLLEQIATLEASLDSPDTEAMEPEKSQTASETLAGLKDQLSELEEKIFILDAMVSERRTYKFSKTADQWRHDVLTELVDGIERLKYEDSSLLQSIRERLEFAETIEFESITNYQEEWDEAIASIADEEECPMYCGLKIVPQVGFVPIGRDDESDEPVRWEDESGLWEFAHLQTGKIPERDADGQLILTEEMGLVFVLIPGGTFNMGAVSNGAVSNLGPVQPPMSQDVDPHAQPDESPVHEVTIRPFFMSKYEFTQGQWLRFVGENPSRYRSGVTFRRRQATLLHPVEQVSWEDCAEVARQLRLRLPSEAEWEYACRGGTTTSWWTGDGVESLEGAANLADQFLKTHGGASYLAFEEGLNDGFGVHSPIGSLRPNAFGLHDVHGNVWEWCQDTYQLSYKGVPTDGAAWQVVGSALRVNRGGGWAGSTRSCRSAYRSGGGPGDRLGDLGFRPAYSLSQLDGD